VGKFWIPDEDTYFLSMLEKGLAWEPDKLDAALSYIKNDRVCIDAGAHIGLYTTVLASIFDTVYAFEPNHATFKCLHANTVGMASVICTRAALGNKYGLVKMCVDNSRVGNTGSYYVQVCKDNKEIKEVQSTRKGAVLEPMDLYNFTNVDFIKFDLEGYEFLALQGASDTIARCKPVIMIEEKKFPGRYTHTQNDSRNLLLAMGYGLKKSIKNDHVYAYEQ